MASQVKIRRIAKLLAQSTSDNPHEAASSLRMAYKLMQNEDIRLEDLLALPIEDLYQETLVKLVDMILDGEEDLSPPARRIAYAECMRLIAEKFTPPKKKPEPEQQKASSREDEARDYRERNNYSAGQQGTGNQENDKSFAQENEKTNPTNNIQEPLGGAWAAIRPWFSHGGFLWLVWREPTMMVRLFFASLIWGAGAAIALMTVAAILHVVTHTQPLYDVPIDFLFPFLTAFGTLWRYRLFVKAVA
jgi:Protein of unknown function (DUF2786)